MLLYTVVNKYLVALMVKTVTAKPVMYVRLYHQIIRDSLDGLDVIMDF